MDGKPSFSFKWSEILENSTYQVLPNTSASWSQRISSLNTYCHLPWWNLTSISPPHPIPQHVPSPQSTSYWRRTLTLAQAYNTMWHRKLLHIDMQTTDNSNCWSNKRESMSSQLFQSVHRMSTLKCPQLQWSRHGINHLNSQPHCNVWAWETDPKPPSKFMPFIVEETKSDSLILSNLLCVCSAKQNVEQNRAEQSAEHIKNRTSYELMRPNCEAKVHSCPKWNNPAKLPATATFISLAGHDKGTKAPAHQSRNWSH